VVAHQIKATIKPARRAVGTAKAAHQTERLAREAKAVHTIANGISASAGQNLPPPPNSQTATQAKNTKGNRGSRDKP
jgi:hypothetical protein